MSLINVSPLLLTATFSVVFFIIRAVCIQISMALRVVVYLSARRDREGAGDQ